LALNTNALIHIFFFFKEFFVQEQTGLPLATGWRNSKTQQIAGCLKAAAKLDLMEKHFLLMPTSHHAMIFFNTPKSCFQVEFLLKMNY
jgi:hypothetical protein